MASTDGGAPRFTVGVLAYNAENYIDRAVQSVLDQTCSDIEVIIVEDMSPDATLERLKRFSDPRITLIEHKENKGPGFGMNEARELARGEWFAYLDTDDWYDPNRLERLLYYAERYDVDMIADNLRYQDQVSSPDGQGGHLIEGGTLFSKSMEKSLPRIMSAEEFVLGNRPGPRNPSLGLMKPIFRTAFLKENGLKWYEDEDFNGDTCFFLRCLAAGARMLIVPEVGYNYRRHSASVTRSADVLYALGEQSKRNQLLLEEHKNARREIISALNARQRAIDRAQKFERTRERLEHGKLGEVLRSPQDIPSYLSFATEARGVYLRNRFRGARAKVRRILNGTTPRTVKCSGLSNQMQVGRKGD